MSVRMPEQSAHGSVPVNMAAMAGTALPVASTTGAAERHPAPASRKQSAAARTLAGDIGRHLRPVRGGPWSALRGGALKGLRSGGMRFTSGRVGLHRWLDGPRGRSNDLWLGRVAFVSRHHDLDAVFIANSQHVPVQRGIETAELRHVGGVDVQLVGDRKVAE